MFRIRTAERPASPNYRTGVAQPAVAGLLAVAFAFVPGNAGAQTPLCDQIRLELDNVAQAATEPEDPAIGRQLQRLREADRQAEAAGCDLAEPGREPAVCPALERSIRQMRQNLVRLRGNPQVEQVPTTRDQDTLLAALAAHGCSDERQADLPPDAEADDGPVTRIFGGRVDFEDGKGRTADSMTRILRSGEDVADRQPGLRTFCVRTCDGYVFPLSQSASRFDFRRDQSSCDAACPGTPTQLYFRSEGGGDDLDLMTSAQSGRLYMELPTAGLYRQSSYKRPASCSCTAGAMPRNFQIMTGSPSSGFGLRQTLDVDTAPGATSGSVMVIPAPTLPEAAPPKPVKVPAPSTERKVRVVGPTFFPAPEAAAVPQAPDPTPGR